jgi:hypothetical protein
LEGKRFGLPVLGEEVVMFWVLGAIALLVIAYGVRNGRRNADPLNRKAAAEICEYLTSEGGSSNPADIAAILRGNARYRGNARHIASMVPVLLKEAGIPWEVAKVSNQVVLRAAELIPE